MAGRPREFDREAALQAAMLLFWGKGYAGASMNDLCDAMSVRSPSLYAAFESKEALYLSAIEYYLAIHGQPVWDRLAEGATARAGIENLLIAVAGTLPKSRMSPAGCMAVLGAVSDEWPPAIARMVRKVRLDMFNNLHARLEGEVANGELPAATDGATPAELKGAAMAAWPAEAEPVGWVERRETHRYVRACGGVMGFAAALPILQMRSTRCPMVERPDGQASAEQSGFAGVTRKVLERLPLPDNQELTVVEVTYPPGGVAPLHWHPVAGAVYIVEGVAESAYGSDEPRQYRAGETLQDRADLPHTHFRNCDPDRPLRFLTIYVLEPGRPYTLEP